MIQMLMRWQYCRIHETSHGDAVQNGDGHPVDLDYPDNNDDRPDNDPGADNGSDGNNQ